MPKKYTCKIGDHVYYENTVTGSPRTGIINSEPNENGTVDLIDIGSITPIRMNDAYTGWHNVTKIEDALNDEQIMNKIRKTASQYDMTEEEYMKAIKMI